MQKVGPKGVMYMATYEVETYTKYISKNVLTDSQARLQFDVMIKQMGLKLDEWRTKNEGAIVKRDGNGKRNWNITITLVAENEL